MWWIPLTFALLVGGVGAYAYRALEASTRAQLERELGSILQADLKALRIWVEGQKAIVRAEASRPLLLPAVLELRSLAAAGGAEAEQTRGRVLEAVEMLLGPVVREHGYGNYVVLDESARVLADSDGRLLGQRLSVDRSSQQRLLAGEALFVRAVRDVTGGDPDAFAAQGTHFHGVAPIRDGAEVVGALVFRVPASGGFSEILQVARMGQSGETYAFDEDGRMLSESRFAEELVGLGVLPRDAGERKLARIEIRDPGGNLVEGHVPELPLRARPLTRMAADAVAGGSGSDVTGYRDYRGVEVIGAWTWLPELSLGVSTEIDRAEAYAGLASLRWIFGALCAVLLLGAAAMFADSYLLGRLQNRFDRARKLGRYEIVEKIGEGGMGKVYRARHALLRRPTAVKLLDAGSASEEAVRRFEREVQSASSLTHPNTIAIFDYGRTPEGTLYYAMEYLEGTTVAELVAADGAQPEARVVHLMRQAAASLAEAHSVGLVHRDLKPSNVMLCTRGGMHDFVKVLDFGLVRDLTGADAGADLALTRVESLTGTPLYLSPEALESPERVGPWSDVYQLGAVAYYLLTGRHVFVGESLVEVLSQHLNKTPAPPSQMRGETISADLEKLVLQCLEKDPDRRPGSGAELEEALAECRVDGAWTPRQAREWWAEYARSRALHGTEDGASIGSCPSGWQVDLTERARTRSD